MIDITFYSVVLFFSLNVVTLDITLVPQHSTPHSCSLLFHGRRPLFITAALHNNTLKNYCSTNLLAYGVSVFHISRRLWWWFSLTVIGVPWSFFSKCKFSNQRRRFVIQSESDEAEDKWSVDLSTISEYIHSIWWKTKDMDGLDKVTTTGALLLIHVLRNIWETNGVSGKK